MTVRVFQFKKAEFKCHNNFGLHNNSPVPINKSRLKIGVNGKCIRHKITCKAFFWSYLTFGSESSGLIFIQAT